VLLGALHKSGTNYRPEVAMCAKPVVCYPPLLAHHPARHMPTTPLLGAVKLLRTTSCITAVWSPAWILDKFWNFPRGWLIGSSLLSCQRVTVMQSSCGGDLANLFRILNAWLLSSA
jgi:hypothetical protein